MIIPIENKTVTFNGAQLMGVKANNGKVYAAVSWICKGLGFDKNHKDRQVKNIQTDLVLKEGCVKFAAGVLDPHNEVLAIELDYLTLWLAKISITPKMQQETPWIARMLKEYQLKAKDALAAAFLPKQPQTIEDLIIMQAQSMKEMKAELEQVKNVVTTVNHRIDNLDSLDTIGDLQQRFNAMIRRYAQQEGISFRKAWNEFKSAYNVAYRTNLTTKINNYQEKHGFTKLTMPQYFSVTESLPDAIRVVDKMLNREIAVS